MDLTLLVPDIQGAILFLPRTERGRDPIVMRDVLSIAAELDWQKQRRLWRKLFEELGRSAPGENHVSR
jgi:hypothetical protein